MRSIGRVALEQVIYSTAFIKAEKNRPLFSAAVRIYSLGNKLPKQYVNFVGRPSMLVDTIRRAQKLIPENRIVTIVSRHHLKYAEERARAMSAS